MKSKEISDILVSNNTEKLQIIKKEDLLLYRKFIDKNIQKYISQDLYFTVEYLLKNDYMSFCSVLENNLFLTACKNANSFKYIDLFYQHNLYPNGMKGEYFYGHDLMTLLFQENKLQEVDYLLKNYNYPTHFLQSNNYLEDAIYSANIDDIKKVTKRGFILTDININKNVDTNVNTKKKIEKFFNLIDFFESINTDKNLINKLLNRFVFNSKKMTPLFLQQLNDRYQFHIDNNELVSHYSYGNDQIIFNNNPSIIEKYIDLGMNVHIDDEHKHWQNSVLNKFINEKPYLQMFKALQDNGFKILEYISDSTKIYRKINEHIINNDIPVDKGLDILIYIHLSQNKKEALSYDEIVNYSNNIKVIDKNQADKIRILLVEKEKQALLKSLNNTLTNEHSLSSPDYSKKRL